MAWPFFVLTTPNLSIAHQKILQFQNVKSSDYAGYILLHCILFLSATVDGRNPTLGV